MTTNRIAVIDLGTNTFHLLIVQLTESNHFEALHQEKFAAKIGKGGISKGILTEEAYQRTLGALQSFRNKINQYGISEDKIFATATSAFRSAQNGQQLVEAIKVHTGIRVEIISGDKEAEYIYYGVKKALAIGNRTSMIMDIGGGSVEFIICNEQTIFWKKSFEIGGQRLIDLFMPTDPISTGSVQRLNDYLEETLIPLTNAIHQYEVEVLIGASGAFETLCDINAKRTNQPFDTDNFREATLPIGEYTRIHQELVSKSRTERLAIPGMLEMRADMIVVASCLINFVLNKYAISQMRVSAYALKEGVLNRILESNAL